MSIFQQKLNKFLNNNWESDIDRGLCSEISKEKNNLFNNQVDGQNYIKQIISTNKQLLMQATPEFQEEINKLTTYITENFDGYWTDVSLEICMKDHSIIPPEVMERIKKQCSASFGFKIKNDIEYPKNILVAPKVPLKKKRDLLLLLRKINKNLDVDIRPSTGNYNIANKINKSNQSKVMENKISDLDKICNKVERIFEKADIAYESNSLKKFISKNMDKVQNICENISSKMDVHRLCALMESNDLKENTTADMNVPEMAVSSSLVRNRLKNFDPFGKNVANTSNNTKTVIKMDADVLKESIKKINLDLTTIIGTDIETSNKFSRVIIEHKNRKSELVIDKKDFLKFVTKKANVNGYIIENKFDYKKYFAARTSAFVGVLLKEYFKTILKEGSENDLTVENFIIEGDKIRVQYFFKYDEEGRETMIDLNDFSDFVKDQNQDMIENNRVLYYTHNNDVDFESPQGSYDFDFDRFFEEFSFVEQLNMIKQYMIYKNLGQMTESKSTKKVVDDYNQWKSMVATNSLNEFVIKDTDKNFVAKNSKDVVLGEWDIKEKKGYIYI